MTLPNILSWNWSIEPIILAILLMAGYAWISRKQQNIYKMLLFAGGLIVGEIALALPLGPTPPGFTGSSLSCALPGGTLLSMHMIRHVLLLMLAAPLLVAGLPEEPLRKFVSRSGIKPWAKRLSSPYIGWIAGVGAMWVWHTPFIYNYLVTYGTGLGHIILPRVEIITLLIAGALLAWPVLSSLKEYRIHPLKGCLYLFLACVGCSILGMTITFASTGFFNTAFASQPGPIWGLSQTADQQIAGLFMWVPGCILYVTGAMAMFGRWAYQMEHPSKPAHHTEPVVNGSATPLEKNNTGDKKHSHIPPIRNPKTATT
jgi:cytochrome c oxidase assembly factor CtaG